MSPNRRPLVLALAALALANVAAIVWTLTRSAPAGSTEPGPSLLDERSRTDSRFDLRDTDHNLILLSLDALRFDRTGFGGNDRPVTPNLDRLAEESVVFLDATAQGSWTLPSHMSVFTGRWPSIHGVVNKLRRVGPDRVERSALNPAIPTIPEHLARAGFTCAAFTGDAGVSGEFGFSRGFETYLDDRKFGGLEHSLPPAVRWMEEHRDRRFFLFLHGYDVHGQYEPVSGYTRTYAADYAGPLAGDREEQGRLREEALAVLRDPSSDGRATSPSMGDEDFRFYLALYDEKVRAMDERVGQLVRELQRMGLYERTVIAVISDHGEEFGEHGSLDHGPTLYQEMVHIPMLIRFPGYARRLDVTEPVRQMDVLPTVCDALGVPVPAGLDATSLLPLLRGGTFDAPVIAETDYRLFVHRRMLREGPWKLILDLRTGRREVYDLSTDPTERNELSSRQPRRTYELEQGLREWMREVRQSPDAYRGLEEAPIEEY